MKSNLKTGCVKKLSTWHKFKTAQMIIENTWLELFTVWLIQDCTTKQVKTHDISVKAWNKNSL